MYGWLRVALSRFLCTYMCKVTDRGLSLVLRCSTVLSFLMHEREREGGEGEGGGRGREERGSV